MQRTAYTDSEKDLWISRSVDKARGERRVGGGEQARREHGHPRAVSVVLVSVARTHRQATLFKYIRESPVAVELYEIVELPNLRKNDPFFESSLCLSRACIGKMFVLMHKWL